MKIRSHTALIWAGVVLIIFSPLLYVALEISVTREQGLSPGEKSLGVAVLGMLFGIPTIISGLAAIVCLVCGLSMAAYRKLVSK